MKYQLVLQWPASTIEDYDAMIQTEDALIDGFGDDHEVDGHDAGSGEVNIFIHTNDPKDAFKEIKSILGDRDIWREVRIAYREIAKEKYIILWPENLRDFKVI